MSKTTTNLGLIKPELTDAADITTMNQNWDKIDAKLNNVCTLIVDWNAATTNGWYMGNDADNSPGTGWYFGQAIVHNSNYVLQEVYQFSASSDARYIPKYLRAKTGGTWGQWVDVTVQTKVPVDAILDGAKKDLSNVTDDTIQSKVNGVFATKVFQPYCVELTPPDGSTNGGFIDFHFAGDKSKDYTARIIEATEGVLNVVGGLKVNNNNVYHAGNKPTLSELGAAAVEHTHSANAVGGGKFAGRVMANDTSSADLSLSQVRNINAGTSDLTAGTSQISSGCIYIVYE